MPFQCSKEVKRDVQALLLKRTPYSVIQKMYSSKSKSTLTYYRKKYLQETTPANGSRPSKISKSTQKYIVRGLCTGAIDGTKGTQRILRSKNVNLTTSAIKKHLKKHGFKAKKRFTPIW